MRKKTTHKKTSNRVPPSIPKCVKKCTDGYMTGYVTTPDNTKSVKFIFKKTDLGYSVLLASDSSYARIDMGSDTKIAPATRHLFSNLTTLKSAIAAVEKWLGCSLPEIR